MSLAWSVIDHPNIASVNGNTGTVTGVSAGWAIISCHFVGSTADLAYFTLFAVEIPEGTYFIKNRETEKYVQVDNDIINPDPDSSPDYSGQVMELWPFDGGSYQKWKFEFAGGGYYKIITNDHGYAITVPTGEETNDDVDLIMSAYCGSDNQKWSISLTHNGSYKIKAKSSESCTAKDLVMDLEYVSGGAS